MKKIKQLGTIAFFALALTFGSCSSDDDGGSTGGDSVANGTINATVDGNNITTLVQTTGGLVSGTDFSMIGSTISGETLQVSVKGFTGVGTYNLLATSTNIGAELFYSKIDMNDPESTHNLWTAPFGSNTGVSGIFTVTEITDTNIKGTFSFKGANDLGNIKEVKNGKFNVILD